MAVVKLILMTIIPCNTGHQAFLGFFYLDYAYNNAVVHVFMEKLKESLEENPTRSPSSTGSSSIDTKEEKIAATNFPPLSK